MINWACDGNYLQIVLAGLAANPRLSYAQIARLIPGATRNSVAGIVHRMHKAAQEEAGAPPPKSPAAAKRRAA